MVVAPEVIQKYRDCAGPVLSKQDVERSIELVENLEDVKNITELVDSVLGSK